LARNILSGAFPKGVTIPIDIDFLAEDHLHLQIFPLRGLMHSYGAYGVFMKWPKGHFDLVIDEDIMDGSPPFYRFTIGEEIAHYVLHRHYFAATETIEDACEVHSKLQEHYEGIERNAKWFSSALLMPYSDIKAAAARNYEAMVRAVGFDDPKAILSTLTAKLAEEFCVSREAMKYRLTHFPCRVYDAALAALAQSRTNLW
jgi:Zn-dependent peptidase ImmA (M78 family)